MWKKNNNKPHSVTMDIRGNKGLFAYFKKFKSIITEETSGIIKIVINIRKKSIQRICLPLTLLLFTFYEIHYNDLVGHTGLEKTKRNKMEKYYFPNLNTWIKNNDSRLHKIPNKQSVCKYENKKQTRTTSINKNILQRNDND